MISDRERDVLLSRANRYRQLIHQKEREIEELKRREQTLREEAADDLPDGALPTTEKNTESLEHTASRYNLTFAKDIGEYVTSYPWDLAININQMLNTLKKEKGIQGKQKSLYAYSHQVLRRKADTHEHGLHYEKGVGYYKTRGENSSLVASMGAEGLIAEKKD